MGVDDVLREPFGARWTRVDLHLHSPGVFSFRCPDGADLRSERGRSDVAKRYVERLVASGIQVAAITDYNGIREEWFTLIRKLAADRGVVVLPGAELSFQEGEHGLHILAIFPGEEEPAAINRAVDSLDKNHQDPLRRADRSHREIQPEKSVIEALRQLRERSGCLLIPPHPTTQKGVLKTYKPKLAAMFLAELRPDAVEYGSRDELLKLEDTGVVDRQWLSQLALVEFSDPKAIEEVGAERTAGDRLRVTHLKLSAYDVAAMRLALHDPETRLCIGGPPRPAYNRIVGMEVEGSGFLGTLRLRWNDELNVLIGGRGVGKSAVIETLRYALSIEPYAEASYRDDLVRHALASGGKVTVLLDRVLNGDKVRRYAVERVLGESARVFEIGVGSGVSVPPGELLGPAGAPTIFGQREIYFVSTSEAYRLRLLDELIGEEARDRNRAVREAVEAIRGNARSIQEHMRRLAKREEYGQKLKNIDHEIETYERHGVAQKLRDATDLRADGQHLSRSGGVLQEVRTSWEETWRSIVDRLEGTVRQLKGGRSRQKSILQEAASVLESLRTTLNRLGQEALDAVKAAEASLGSIRGKWDEGVKPLEEELNRVKRELRTDALDPDRLLRLTEDRTGLGPLMDELNRIEGDLQQLRQSRTDLLSEYRDRRYEEHALRRERAREVGEKLAGRLRLLVDFKGQKDEFQKRLSAQLKGSGITNDAVQKLVSPAAADGLAIAQAVRQNAKEVQDKFGLTAGMAERLCRWLTEDEGRLFELETLVVDDAVHVELRVDEGEYRRLDRLSIGQRATAILLLLLAQEGRPLVLDQPEDDLDNRFVYEDIVAMLRREKGKRQIIAATHNANIPVLGDAELIVVLDVANGQARMVRRASLDDTAIREAVKGVMEGGEEAFRRRAEKYGGLWAE